MSTGYRPLLWVLLVTAWLLPRPAAAQLINPCTGAPAAAGAVAMVDYAASAPAACGSPTARTYRVNSAGVIAWRYCRRPAGTYYPEFVAGAWAEAASAPQMAADIIAAGIGADEATVQALAKKYIDKPLSHPLIAPVWCPVWPEIVAGIPPTQAAAAWVTSSSTAYVAAGGALKGVAGTVKLGTACNCAAPLLILGRTYCTFDGAPVGAVAACVKK